MLLSIQWMDETVILGRKTLRPVGVNVFKRRFRNHYHLTEN